MKRIESFDIAKGIALIAVMVGHTSYVGVPDCIVDATYAFTMPLFFIVSGYFLKPETQVDGAFLQKNLRGLIVPYIITSILVILLSIPTSLLMGWDVAGQLFYWVLAALYGSGSPVETMPAGIGFIGAIWYLLALFWAKATVSLSRRTEHPLPLLCILFALSYLSKEFLWLPLAIQPGICAALFLYIGQQVRSTKVLEDGVLPTWAWVLMALTGLIAAIHYGHLYMVTNIYADGPIDAVGGVCLTLCIIKGSEYVHGKAPFLVGWLAKVGRYSLPLFCMHLVELDAAPWELLLEKLSSLPLPVWIGALLVRFLLVAVLTFILWLMPARLSGCFFPEKR